MGDGCNAKQTNFHIVHQGYDAPLDCSDTHACFYQGPNIESLVQRDDEGIKLTRWTDHRQFVRDLILETPENCFIVVIAVRPVELRISHSGGILLDGAMPSGACYVVGAPHHTHLNIRSSLDFLCLRIATHFVSDCRIDVGGDTPRLFRDPVIESLVRALVDNGEHSEAFALGIARAIAARSLGRCETQKCGAPLPKWRLARLERYLADRLHEVISLEEMADAVELSRMHFAKSFRLATGFTPHEYLLFRRIEWAKNAMLNSRMNLCEIALEAGFQAQAHFSTVFKRFTGTSPAKWKLDNIPRR